MPDLLSLQLVLLLGAPKTFLARGAKLKNMLFLKKKALSTNTIFSVLDKILTKKLSEDKQIKDMTTI